MAIRATVWPRPNLQRFTDILDASPNLVKMVVGEKGETLLHRWVGEPKCIHSRNQWKRGKRAKCTVGKFSNMMSAWKQFCVL